MCAGVHDDTGARHQTCASFDVENCPEGQHINEETTCGDDHCTPGECCSDSGGHEDGSPTCGSLAGEQCPEEGQYKKDNRTPCQGDSCTIEECCHTINKCEANLNEIYGKAAGRGQSDNAGDFKFYYGNREECEGSGCTTWINEDNRDGILPAVRRSSLPYPLQDDLFDPGKVKIECADQNKVFAIPDTTTAQNDEGDVWAGKRRGGDPGQERDEARRKGKLTAYEWPPPLGRKTHAPTTSKYLTSDKLMMECHSIDGGEHAKWSPRGETMGLSPGRPDELVGPDNGEPFWWPVCVDRPAEQSDHDPPPPTSRQL